MANFFKGIGKGLLNIVTIPVWAIGLFLSAVVGLFVFFWEFIKKIGKFITGKSLTNDLPEDIQAKEMLKTPAEKQKEKKDDVEIVQAEIADPSASLKHNDGPLPRTIGSDEEVDFVVDDREVEVEIPNDYKQIENKEFEEPINVTKTEEPKEEKIVEEVKNDTIEEYKPKGSDF